MSFDNIMDLFAHEFEMHPLSSWYEEVEESQIEPEIVIPDLALADNPDLEFNIVHSEKRKAEGDLQSQPNICVMVHIMFNFCAFLGMGCQSPSQM